MVDALAEEGLHAQQVADDILVAEHGGLRAHLRRRIVYVVAEPGGEEFEYFTPEAAADRAAAALEEAGLRTEPRRMKR